MSMSSAGACNFLKQRREARVPPVVFVSVASKGLTHSVSLLFATLVRRPISVAAKGVREEQRRQRARGRAMMGTGSSDTTIYTIYKDSTASMLCQCSE